MSAVRLPQSQQQAAAAPARPPCRTSCVGLPAIGRAQKQQKQRVTTRVVVVATRARASENDDTAAPDRRQSFISSSPDDDEPYDSGSRDTAAETTAIPTAAARAAAPRAAALVVAATMAAATLADLSSPRPARAADAVVSWKPRRHHRHIGERFTDRWADAVAEAEEQGKERVRDLERRLAAANARADGEATTRKAAEARVRALQQSQAVGGGRGGYYDEGVVALRVLGADVTPLLLAGAAVFAWWRAYSTGALAEWTGGRLGAGGGRRRRRAGRWVYDRSLGGKRVWVPEAGEDEDGGFAGGSGGWGGKKTAAAGGAAMSDADFDALAARAATASVAAGATALSAAQPAAKKEAAPPPAWWEDAQPRRIGGLDARTKGDARAEAQRLLRRMEQAKNAGEDYPLEVLLALRRACQQAGTPNGPGEPLVEARTVGGRDALFRAAVDAAVRAAGEPGSVDLGGEDPLRLCAGLAGDLGVTDARAVSAVRGRLAGAARARVVEAIAALSRGDGAAAESGRGGGEGGGGDGGDGDALLALDKLASLLEGMPGVLGGEMPEGWEAGEGGEGAGGADSLLLLLSARAAAAAAPVAPEVELVASELNKWAPVPARERVLALYCQLDPARAALVARMLDFDPQVALPRVTKRLKGAREAREAAGGSGSNSSGDDE